MTAPDEGAARRVYKIMSDADWARFQADGAFAGAEVDLRDGYVHLSTAAQAPETLRLHFHGRGDLVLLAFEAAALGPQLRWEPSRGGQLFPHLYAPLPLAAVGACEPVELGADGAPRPRAPLGA